MIEKIVEEFEKLNMNPNILNIHIRYMEHTLRVKLNFQSQKFKYDFDIGNVPRYCNVYKDL